MRNTILLTDYSPTRRSDLRDILESRYTILESGTIEQARFFLEEKAERLAAFLVDISWLEESGGNILAELRKSNLLKDIPVIVVTRAEHPDDECNALDWGAIDTLVRPLHKDVVRRRMERAISAYVYKWNLEGIIREQQESISHSNEIMTDALSSIIEHRSIESGKHVLRIRRFTQILLEEVAANCPEYELDSRTIRLIASAAALHDIGKIAIPDAILNKPGRLTSEEFEIMKTHTVEGSAILERLGGIGNVEYLRYAYNICRYHHERWDGRGYPEGLVGDNIPICAQVVGLVDAYDALTTPRVYKEAFSHSKAVNMILGGECGAFSRELLECFKHVRDTFAELARQYADGEIEPSAAIAEPIPIRERAEASAMHRVLTKYDQLLNYINATVMEVDWNEGVYHVVYSPKSELQMLQNDTDLERVFRQMDVQNLLPEEKSLLYERYSIYMNAFFDSGLRRSEWNCRVREALGTLRYYSVTTLRLSDAANDRRALCIWNPMESDSRREEAVRSQKKLQQEIMALDALLICRYDRWLTLESSERALKELLQWPEEEFSGRCGGSFLNCIAAGKREYFMSELKRQFAAGSVAKIMVPLAGKGGRRLWMLVKGVLAVNEDGIEQITFQLTDITDTEYVSHELPLSIENNRSIMARSGDIPFSWDMTEDRILISPRWKERFGYDPIAESVSERLLQASHFHPDDLPTLKKRFDELREGKDFVECAARIADADGRYSWNFIRAAAPMDDDGRRNRLYGTIIDVGDSMIFSSVLLDSATRDPLTQLTSKVNARSKIESYLYASSAAEKQALAALIIIDLDNFKEINDSLGHMFGDEVLEQVARELSGLFRHSDIVARIGGDEFMIFMSGIPSRETVINRCEALISRIRTLNVGAMENCRLSCSVGVSFTPEHGDTYQDLFQKADEALYQAKRGGKGCCAVYNPESSNTVFSSIISQIDSEKHPELVRDNLVRFVFDSLYESDNIIKTIRSLMEVVGKQINASRVYIFENSADNSHCSNTFEWVNENVEPEIEKFQNMSYETDLPDFESYLSEQNIICCSDTRTLQGSIRTIVDSRTIRSVLLCAIREKGVFRGFVGFDDERNYRRWTQGQIDLLTFMSKIISIFLLKRRAREHAAEMVKNMQRVLDDLFAWSYVVDAESYRLHFLNERSKKLVQGTQVGDVCYRVFMNRDEPCEGCPMKSGGASVDIRNDYLDLDVEASAKEIHWKDRKAWLVMCSEKKDQK